MLLPAISIAAEFRAGEQPSFSAGEISKDLYMAGGNVTSSGAVTGDLVVVGGNILVQSAVSADLAAAGGSISILGTVGDDLRAAGGNITIAGAVRGDVVVGGGQTQLSGSGIGGDVLWGGGTLRIDAPVVGNLQLGGGEVFLNAPVGGNVHFTGDKLTLGSGAVITGNLTYSSPKEAERQEGAVVRGETTYTESVAGGGVSKGGIAAILSLALLLKFLSVFACALVLSYIFRRFALALVSTAVAQPLMEIGRGFVALLVLPVASVLLLLTLIGLPIGALGLLGFVLALVFASIAMPIVLGALVHRWIFKPAEYEISWKTVLLGSVLSVVLGLIPFIGWIVCFGFFLLTFGAAVKIKWETLKEWR